MKIAFGLSLAILLLFAVSQEALAQRKTDYTKFVNPFIGTGGHGHTFPGATLPFGMIQLSPDSRLDGWDGCGGYHYSDNVIHGFSHTHLSGTGVSDYGDLLVMPFTGEDKWENDSETKPELGYSSKFSHGLESASPGYYSVQLLDYNINAEFAVTDRCGIHKYTFPSGSKRKIIIDLEHRDKLVSSDLIFLNDSTVMGSRVSNAWAREQHFYFCLRISETPVSHRFKKDENGVSTKLILEFDDSSPFLNVKVGISSVDLKGAKNNLNSEMPHWSLPLYKKKGREKWNKELGKMHVETPNKDDKIIFYTALYHSFICPNLFTDVDGRYRGMDMEIHAAGGQNQYTIFSLWDTFRATHPLFTITQQKRTEAFITTFLRQYKEGGILPIWELNANYTGCMIGYHSIPVFTDALIKGIDGFNTKTALEAMVYSADQNHLGLEAYKMQGFISSEDESESVSKTLEYAYDDWCIGVFAEAIGEDSIAERFFKRAQGYKHIFNDKSGFMQPRYNGGWKNNFQPNEVTFDYTEANSWQYSLFAPHDIHGLRELIGGKDALEQWLDDLFSTSSETSGRHQVDITGLIGQYAHGNEPSHHMAYLYNYTNNPHKGQKFLHQIMKTLYFNSSDGLSGNEDCGQMSSWYVFSALGFYPVTPGSPYYNIGTPNVENAKLNLENGNTFEVSVSNFSQSNYYVKEAKLNGNKLSRNYILHSEIMNGGILEFEMSSTPINFSTTHPPSQQYDKEVLPVPYVMNAESIFKKKRSIALECADSSAVIEYLVVPNDVPETTASTVFSTYSSPIKIKRSSKVIFKASKGELVSPIIESNFYKTNDKWEITLNSPHYHQYSGGGNNALIDRLNGGNDFRTGAWQGFRGRDMDVQINFKKKLKLEGISVRFLQDARSWIWFPTEVQFMISKNGRDWFTLDVIKNDVSPKEYGVIIKEFTTKQQIKTKHIRIVAKYLGTIPQWHPGSGESGYIFADEIEMLR